MPNCSVRRATGFWLASALLASTGTTKSAEPKISFNNQVQPILSEYCYPCHGPDSSTRKPKKHPMRLDKPEFAFEPRLDDKPVIIKGHPESSEVIRRIKATDDDIMPPASEHKTIKPSEIVTLEKWIAQGAEYEKHWSLIPPTRQQAPSSKGNPIDGFVTAKLRENGLKLNPEEKKTRLFRRLCFDLTGLPPTPAELNEFLKDKSSRAYENAVERLLASDACAEQFTRHWLDAVRYADTQGIHHDHARSIWPYRDWVLNAYKTNMNFAQFTVEQIAGDLLPHSTMSQKIASGYNRLLPTTGEGGAIPDEYAAIYARDRVDTTAAVWLGLTTGCATCHDHKFDPISTKEFYSMTAFFRNSTVPSLDSPVNANTPPLLFVPADQDLKRWPELQKDMTAKQKELEQRKLDAGPDFKMWLASVEHSLAGATNESSNDSAPHFILKQPAIEPVLELGLTGTNSPYAGRNGEKTIEWTGGPETVPGPFGRAPTVGGEAVSNAAPAFSRRQEASYGAFILVHDKPTGSVFSRMNQADGYRGWDLYLTEGRPTVHVIDQWPDKTLKVTAKEALLPGEWHHVMAAFNGKLKGSAAVTLYVDGKKAEVEVNNNSLGANITTDVPLRLGGRSNKGAAVDGVPKGKVFLQDLRFYNRALTQEEVGLLAAEGLARAFVAAEPGLERPKNTNALLELYLANFDKVVPQIEMQLSKLKAEESEIQMRGATTLIMEEKQDSQPTAYVLTRGNYAAKGAEVTAAVPAALPRLPQGAPTNRLGLAEWIMAPENPLTARVTVNRLWSYLFGVGIVETTEDFGVKGARPTNQPLLDWLAVEFRDSGWDFRHMIRLMVTSAAYKQSEAITPEKLEKDPLDRLYSRGPHLRLDAEELRDQALAASGLLVRKWGGPSVKPYQPEGVWESVAMKDSNTRVYVQDKGESLYRRSLYTFWKRTAPPPSMEILNAPSRDVFCTRRDRTDTPLQAFVTMNDPQFVEAARQLAALALEQGKTFGQRLDVITEKLLARDLNGTEKAIVRKVEEKALDHYRQQTDAARLLLAVGESKADPNLPAPELAAWTLVASEVMNMDESLTK